MDPGGQPHTPCCLLLFLLLSPLLKGVGGGSRDSQHVIRLEPIGRNTPEVTVYPLVPLGPDHGEEYEGEGVGLFGDPLGDKEPSITWGRANTLLAHFGSTPTNVSVIVGHRANLPCKVTNLAGKDVSWIRQRDLHILTVGIYTYTTDDRFKVRHPTGSDHWALEITPVTFRDAGVYECQVSTAPKISLPVTLTVAVQKARIEGPSEVYIQKGSTVRLTCRLNTHPDNVGSVSWFRDSEHLDYDSPRGGVSVEVERTPTSTTSKLFLTRAHPGDGGNYTCRPQHAAPASVMMHVVNGEESAAVHKADASRLHPPPPCLLLLLLLLLLLSSCCCGGDQLSLLLQPLFVSAHR